MDAIRNMDKRRSVRRASDFGALVRLDFGDNEVHYRAAKVLDVSTNSLRVTISGDVEMGEHRAVIGVLVELPDGPGYFECRVTRVKKAEDTIELGTVMAESDPSSRQSLYEFLTGRKLAKAA